MRASVGSRPSKRLLPLFILLGLALVFMGLDAFVPAFNGVRMLLARGMVPVQYAVDYPMSLWYANHRLIADNHALQKEVLTLKYLIAAQDATQYNQQEVQNLLKKVQATSHVVRVLQVSGGPYVHQYVLNKGTAEGIDPGDAALDAKGVLGQIVFATRDTSRVLLLTAKGSAIPVRNQRTGLQAIVRGDGQAGLWIRHLSTPVDIKPGDIFVTSGIGKVYPADYPVAVVLRVTQSSDQVLTNVFLKPLAQLSQNQFVMVVDQAHV